MIIHDSGYARHAYPPEPCIKIPDRVRQLIAENGMEAGAFAQRAGVSRNGIYCIIRGDNFPSLITIARICFMTYTSADWLLFGRGEKEMPKEGGDKK